MVLLRLRAPTGTSDANLASDATLADLHDHIKHNLGIPRARQELRLGFPPKPLDPAASPSATLASLGIKTGEAIVVAERDPPAPTPASSSSSSTAAPPSIPQKRASSPPAPPLARKPAATQPAAPPRPAPPAAGDLPAFVEADGGYLVLRQVPDDNSCLFRAVGLVLAPSERDAAASLRQVVARAIQADQASSSSSSGAEASYSAAVLGRAPAEYVETILRPSSWGGAIELAVFARHFGTEIWSVDVQTGRVDRFGEGDGYEQFALIVYSGIHYDALTFSFAPPEPSTGAFPPPNLDFDTTVFPRYQEHLLDAALTLVGQLRARHAYTDTASFTLKCGECGTALKGEKEARQHAESSGHTAFTEYDG
ncbi:hypothetical protein JCM9279_006766 [Rhodotorula babjevae]